MDITKIQGGGSEQLAYLKNKGLVLNVKLRMHIVKLTQHQRKLRHHYGVDKG